MIEYNHNRCIFCISVQIHICLFLSHGVKDWILIHSLFVRSTSVSRIWAVPLLPSYGWNIAKLWLIVPPDGEDHSCLYFIPLEPRQLSFYVPQQVIAGSLTSGSDSLCTAYYQVYSERSRITPVLISLCTPNQTQRQRGFLQKSRATQLNQFTRMYFTTFCMTF